LDRQGLQETLGMDALARGRAGALLRSGRGLLFPERELRDRALPAAVRGRLRLHGPDVARPGLHRTAALRHCLRRNAAGRHWRAQLLTRVVGAAIERTAMADGSGSTGWSFDVMGRILTEQRTIAG